VAVRKTIGFAVDIAHSEALSAMFAAAGEAEVGAGGWWWVGPVSALVGPVLGDLT